MIKMICVIFSIILMLNIPWISGQHTCQIVDFPQMDALTSFHTKVDYRSNSHKKSAYIEEYYNSYAGRGRLEIITNGTQYSYSYENQTQQILQINSNRCHGSNDDNLTNSMHSIFDGAFYGFVDAGNSSLRRGPLAGPTALLRRVMRGLRDKTLVCLPAGQTTTIRNISCKKFIVTGTAFPNIVLTFYFMDDSWNRFESTQFKNLPIRVSINGTDGDDTPLDVDMDFFLFELFAPTLNWQNVLPPIGMGCVGKKSSKTLPNISNKFRTDIEFFDVGSQRTDPQSEQQISRINLNYDGANKFLRVDAYDTITEETTEIVMDFNRGISYIFSDQQKCLISHTQSSQVESAIISLNIRNDSYYMGQTDVRGMYCDVWERVIYNETTPQDYRNITFAKIVVTNYILDNKTIDENSVESKTDVPIKTLYTGYLIDGQSPTFQVEINFFSFVDTTDNDDDLLGVFDIRNCFTDEDMRKYIELYIPLEGAANASFVKQNVRQLREILKEMISAVAHISPLRIPFMELEFSDTTILANVMILDKERVSLSFKKFSNSLPQKDETKVRASSDNDCARIALARNARGYHWCKKDKTCYVKNDTNVSPNRGQPIVPERTASCDLYMLDLNIQDDSLTSIANISTAIANLEGAVDSGTFSFNLFFNDGSSSIFTVNRLVISDEVVVDVYGNSLFTKALDRYELNSDLLSTKVVNMTTSDDSVPVIGDCYEACASDSAIECASFTFCNGFDETVRCAISSHLIYDAMANKSTEVIESSDCNTYAIPYLNRYRRLDGEAMLSSGDANVMTDSANLCAEQCTQYQPFQCKSFQYCSTGECFLRRDHYLSPHSMDTDTHSGLTGCAIYTAKYLTDYKTTGFTTDRDLQALEVAVDSAEVCAKQCSTQTDNCLSFDFCAGAQNQSNFCLLSAKSITDNNPVLEKTASKGMCRHYELKNRTVFYGEPQTTAPEGITSGNFFGLIFGLFVLGAILGAVGLIAVVYYKREISIRNGQGFSVRFNRDEDLK